MIGRGLPGSNGTTYTAPSFEVMVVHRLIERLKTDDHMAADAISPGAMNLAREAAGAAWVGFSRILHSTEKPLICRTGARTTIY